MQASVPPQHCNSLVRFSSRTCTFSAHIIQPEHSRKHGSVGQTKRKMFLLTAELSNYLQMIKMDGEKMDFDGSQLKPERIGWSLKLMSMRFVTFLGFRNT